MTTSKPQNAYVMTGYMNKISDGFYSKWSRKYFELRNDILSYYPDDEKQKSTNIPLVDVQVVYIKEEHAGKKNVLGVSFAFEPITATFLLARH